MASFSGSIFSNTAIADSGYGTRPRVINPGKLKLVPVTDLTGVTALAARAGDSTLFIAHISGQVIAITQGEASTKIILDRSDRITAGDGKAVVREQGLLGMTFSPDGDKLYINYSGLNGETVIEEFTYKSEGIDTNTGRVLLTIQQPQYNHNGGQIAFGPDQMLYIGMGDGGASRDKGEGHAAEGNGQSQKTLLGKILRIDPRPDGNRPYSIPADNPFVLGSGQPEIFITGVRNPWRFSFDSKTNNLWIADVGQDRVEEITKLKLSDASGANLGWPVYEGSVKLRERNLTTTVKPDIEMTHDQGNCSVTGGYVYRGKQIPWLNGIYLFSDFCNSTIYGVKELGNGEVSTPVDLKISSKEISSFGEDSQGNIYVISLSKGVFRITRAAKS